MFSKTTIKWLVRLKTSIRVIFLTFMVLLLAVLIYWGYRLVFHPNEPFVRDYITPAITNAPH